MKLLILTQKIDKEDPILGFFHNWVLKLSEKFENIVVVCLGKGNFDLPKNVQVFSLGKEKGRNRFWYIFQFFNLCFFQSLKYDAVFVHMNQEYVLLGGLFWKIWNKKIFMWRNHPIGNILTKISIWFSDIVFCTSESAYVAGYKKTQIMPVGVETNILKTELIIKSYELGKRKILFLSRISPIKRPDLLIEALKILNKEEEEFECNFYGDALLKDQKYFDALKERVDEYGLSGKIKFNKAVPNYETGRIYDEHHIFINLTPSGSMDKTILESVVSGCIPIVRNDYFKSIFDSEMLINYEAEDLAQKIKFWLNASDSKIADTNNRLKKYVEENHSLDILINKLSEVINN